MAAKNLKRVPLDFSWPLYEAWKGYLNPHEENRHDCPRCDASGYSKHARHLKDQWFGRAPFKPQDRGSVPLTPDNPAVAELAKRNVEWSPTHFGAGAEAVDKEARRLCSLWNACWSHHLNDDDVAALLAADRLWELTRVRTPEGSVPKEPPYVPTPEEVNALSIGGFGHDLVNAMACVKAACARQGVPYYCEYCNGDETVWISEEAKAAAEAWQPTEPPIGEGFQMWADDGEGYPCSPVFSCAEQLAVWAANHQSSPTE